MVVNRVLASSKSRYRFLVSKVLQEVLILSISIDLERDFFHFFLVFELLLPNGVLYGPQNSHVYGGVSSEDTAATTKHNSKPFLRISIFREGVVGPVWPIPAMCKMCFFVISRPFMREMASYLLVTSQIVPSYGG